MDTAAGPGLGSIEHVVVLMLENRSFDHMLGYLYRDAGNVSPAGQPFDGLTGRESNPGSSGAAVPVFERALKLDPSNAVARDNLARARRSLDVPGGDRWRPRPRRR